MSDDSLDAPRSTADPLLRAVARAPAVTEEPVGQTIAGRYRIVALLGQGGMGRVYEAEDAELGRRVAVKLLRATLAGSQGAAERFVRERTVTATLEHPGIVPVYDAGVTPSGEPFYVMRVARGEPLDVLIAKAGTLERRLGLIPNVAAVADAVAFAHSHGIVHRDLKPANVLVGSFGETLVADWGLAKTIGSADARDGEAALAQPADTRAGAVLGTPAYMAPEQARGRPVDERGDVFALGATLYHVVTGEAPRPGDLDGAPALAGAPVDLIAIIRKALAAEPSARYPRVADVALELRRFQTGQIVGARRYGRAELLLRWARRHRSELLVASVLGAILVAAVVTGVVRVLAERNVALAQRAAAEMARRETALRNDELVLLQARTELSHDPTASLAWLARYPAGAADRDVATLIAADAWSRGVARHVWDLGRTLGSVAFAPDGRTLAAGSKDGQLTFLDVAGGLGRTLRAPDGVGERVVYAPDGTHLATTDGVETVRLWAVATGASRALPGEHAGGPTLSFSPDGALLLARHPGRATRLWRVPSGEPLELSVVPGAIYGFLPGVRGVVVAAGTHLALIDPESRQELAATDLPGRASDVVAPANGDWIGVSLEDGLLLWWPGSGQTRRIPTPPHAVTLLAAAPDGRRVMGCYPSPSDARGASLLDVAAGTVRQLSGDERCTRQAFAFSPDGALFLSTGFGTELRVHDVAEQRLRRLLGHEGTVSDAAFSPDGRWIASAGSDHTVRLWRWGDGDRRVLHEVNALDRVAVTGDLLVADPATGAVGLLDVTTGRRRALSGPRPEPLRDRGTLALSGAVAGFPANGAYVVWDVKAGAGRTLPADIELSENTAAEMTNDGALLAETDPHGVVRIVNLSGGTVRDIARLDDAGFALAWSEDGRRLAAGGRDGTARVFDVATGAEKARLRAPSWVFAVNLSHDGRALAAACADGTVRVLDTATGTVRSLAGHVGVAAYADFAPDDRSLVSSGADGSIRMWDLATGVGRVILREPAAVNMAAFSLDGSAFMVRSGFKVRIWDARGLPPAAAEAATLAAWIAGATSASVDARGGLATR